MSNPPAETAPAVTANPASQTVTAGATASFSATASGTPTPTVQWQVSTNGGSTFTNISAQHPRPTPSRPGASQSGDLYRAAFSNALGTVYSAAARLTVNAAPSPCPSPCPPCCTTGSLLVNSDNDVAHTKVSTSK